MKILVAEDELDILDQYRRALEGNGHKVTTAADGEQCLRIYLAEMQNNTHFDAVVLDHRMPKMDGVEVAKHMLDMHPHQRIIFASAYVRETLVDSVKQLKQVVELLQKPFDLDTLVDTIEDKNIYEKLKKLNVKVKEIRNLNPTHEQVKDLLEGLVKLHKIKVF
ncbi:MAG: response regulator [Thermoproteota archaeon]